MDENEPIFNQLFQHEFGLHKEFEKIPNQLTDAYYFYCRCAGRQLNDYTELCGNVNVNKDLLIMTVWVLSFLPLIANYVFLKAFVSWISHNRINQTTRRNHHRCESNAFESSQNSFMGYFVWIVSFSLFTVHDDQEIKQILNKIKILNTLSL